MNSTRRTWQERGVTGRLVLLVFLLLAARASCDEGVSVAIREEWSAVFGGKPVTYHVSVNTQVSTHGRLLWRLAANGATIERGEVAVNPAPATPARTAVRLGVPAVREGISIQAVLGVSFVREGSSEASASVERTLWIFASDPFAHRKQWLKELDLSLFDPEKTTGPLMEKSGIPFRRIANADALSQASGIVVIGEGVSFRDYRGLPSLMMQAARGANVLCLAPASGEFGFPGSGEVGDVRSPDAMQFRRGDIIRELDKRLDAVAWPPDGTLVASSMKLVGQRGPVVGEIVEGDQGWPWVRLDYRDAGTLMIVGFPIVAKWHSGPSSRYLFASLLGLLAGNDGAGAPQDRQIESQNIGEVR